MKRGYRIILFILMLTTLIFVLLNNTTAQFVERQMMISNFMRSDKAVKCITRQEVSISELNRLCLMNKKIIIYCDLEKNDLFQVIGVIDSNHLFCALLQQDLLWDTNGCRNYNSVAIVGKNILNTDLVDGNKIRLNNVEHEIINVLEIKNNASLDNVVFVNMSAIQQLSANSSFFIDAVEERDVLETIKAIQKDFNIEILSNDVNPQDRISAVSNNYGIIKTYLLVIVLFLVVLYCIFAIKLLKKELVIVFTLGYDLNHLFKYVNARYFKLNYIALSLVLISLLILYICKINISYLLIINLVLCVLICHMVLLIFIWCQYYIQYKTQRGDYN